MNSNEIKIFLSPASATTGEFDKLYRGIYGTVSQNLFLYVILRVNLASLLYCVEK